MLKKFRKTVKPLVIIICVAFIGGTLFMGGSSWFGGGKQNAVAAIGSVNGQPISGIEFQQLYYNELQNAQTQYGRLNGQIIESVKYSVFEYLVLEAIQKQEIEKRKITVTSKEIDEEIAGLKAFYPDNALEEMGYTDAILKNIFEEQLKQDKLREAIAGSVEVTEEQIRDVYEQVEASHILIRVESDEESAWDEGRNFGEFVLAQLAEMDFAEAAKLYSDDSSAANGGALGYFSRGEMVPEFEKAAFDLEVDAISDLVRTQYGYHIIKVTDKELAEGEEFEAIKDQVRQYLVSQQQDLVYNPWLKEQLKTATLEINDHQIAAFSHLISGEIDHAIEHYKLAIEENPQDGYLYASLGNIYAETEQLEEAVEYYELAVEKITNDGELFFRLGVFYEDLEKVDQAVEAYLKTSELMSYDPSAQIVILSILEGLEREDAVEIVQGRLAELETLYQGLEEPKAESSELSQE